MSGRQRVCLLTGAAGFLGTQIIRNLWREYRFAALIHQSEPPYLVQNSWLVDPLRPRQKQQCILSCRADLTRETQVSESIESIVSALGPIDVLINAAGMFPRIPLRNAIRNIDIVTKTFAVNTIAPLIVTTLLCDRIWRDTNENLSRNRNVINISSSAGVFIYPDLGQGVYSASKAALNYISYHLASELWDLGIRVNAIAPTSFPSKINTDSVLAIIRQLDRGDETGEVFLMDENGTRPI